MVNILKDDGKAAKKIIVAKALGNKTLEDKVNVLNNHYNGQIVFKVECSYSGDPTGKIAISEVDSTLDVLELPYIEELSLKEIPLYNIAKIDEFERDPSMPLYRRNNLKVVKLPKEQKEFIVGAYESSWLRNINRLFLWDTTHLDLSQLRLYNDYELQMIIVQSTTGGQAKIYRF